MKFTKNANLELPLIPQLQEKAMVKADELSNQAANFELNFAETRAAAHEGVEAAKSYQEILQSLDLARKAAENASVAGLNAMEQSNGLTRSGEIRPRRFGEFGPKCDKSSRKFGQ